MISGEGGELMGNMMKRVNQKDCFRSGTNDRGCPISEYGKAVRVKDENAKILWCGLCRWKGTYD